MIDPSMNRAPSTVVARVSTVALGGTAAEQCHIIYGGSVKPDNVRELASLADVDGALMGGASLEVRSFFEIVSRSRPSAV